MASRKPATTSKGPTDIDDYLSSVPDEMRALLERLRKTIRSAAPQAVEAISYQMPTFKFQGRALLAFAAFKNHCSIFPMSYAFIRAHEDELKPYYTSKGTIRFTVEKPLPVALVKKLVKTRLAEIAAREKARAAKKRK
jgi:uncharacterized protein YdhG (YjbR/CyaY superfamily)